MTTTKIALTQTVKKGGCAAKLPAGQLREILGQLSLRSRPELVVGTETMDDACLWDLNDGRYLIQTLDFFTPIVDDPKEFGAIAAANALSDVYAMGGAPATALTILAFPTATLDLNILQELMEGAIAKIHEAGAVLAGGHSIDDDTLKLGFSVSGFVSKEHAWTNAGAKEGDKLILTKGVGTGVITSALKLGKAQDSWIASAIQSMTTLNNAPELLSGVRVHAATDVTGFGLSGHAMQMAQASNVSFTIEVRYLPVLVGARECLQAGVVNRAHKTNGDYAGTGCVFAPTLTEVEKLLLVDAQTSGGILLSVHPDDETIALQRLQRRFPASTTIGDVQKNQGPNKVIHFV